MSRHETWRTRIFWNQAGGLLVEEFLAVKRSTNTGTRLIDGVIILDEPKQIYNKCYYNIEGRNVICIQTKQGRLGMYLMGQAFFSRELLRLYNPKSIRTVLICGKDDEVLHPICKKFDIEVVNNTRKRF